MLRGLQRNIGSLTPRLSGVTTIRSYSSTANRVPTYRADIVLKTILGVTVIGGGLAYVLPNIIATNNQKKVLKALPPTKKFVPLIEDRFYSLEKCGSYLGSDSSFRTTGHVFVVVTRPWIERNLVSIFNHLLVALSLLILVNFRNYLN